MSPRRALAVHDRAGDPATALREHLLETTERLLADIAPAALTTRRIARSAGVSDGVLYNHFADKDDLVLAATVRRFRRLLAGYLAALAEPEDGELATTLEHVAQAALELHRESLPLVAGLLADRTLLERFLLEIHREHVGAAEIVGALDRLLAAEREAGRVGAVDTRAGADLLVGAVAVATLTSVLGASRADVDARLRSAISALLTGLEPRS